MRQGSPGRIRVATNRRRSAPSSSAHCRPLLNDGSLSLTRAQPHAVRLVGAQFPPLRDPPGARCCCPGCSRSHFSCHCQPLFFWIVLPFVALGAILFFSLIRFVPVAFAVILVLGLWLVPLFILFPLLIVPAAPGCCGVPVGAASLRKERAGDHPSARGRSHPGAGRARGSRRHQPVHGPGKRQAEPVPPRAVPRHSVVDRLLRAARLSAAAISGASARSISPAGSSSMARSG